jgi:hypothetical protein
MPSVVLRIHANVYAMTTAVAIYAAIVSTASLVLAILAFKAGGPQLRSSVYANREGNSVRIHVVTVNHGRAPITIEGLVAVLGHGEMKAGKVGRVGAELGFMPRSIQPQEWAGPAWPLRLEGHQSVSWQALVPAVDVSEPYALVCVVTVMAPGHLRLMTVVVQ